MQDFVFFGGGGVQIYKGGGLDLLIIPDYLLFFPDYSEISPGK